MKTSELNAEIGLPMGLGKVGGKWVPDDLERTAAWELLVEMTTRIVLVEIPPNEGSIREAISSLREMFPVVRSILNRHGPGLAHAPVHEGQVNFAFLAVTMLNSCIRPLLAKWHPMLQAYEESRPPDLSSVDWEGAWPHNAEVRRDIQSVQESLLTYAMLVARACNAQSLLPAVTFRPTGTG